jgi:pimeloyl-ACP methyl ester carboxylesterase
VSELSAWIEAALERRPLVGDTEVAGARIRYRAWGSPGRRDIVLVHGGAAHSRWWDHIAPHLATDGRVVALDLSGHGDSDRRTTYSLDLWGAEVLAVGTAAGLTDPTIVGHSLGGLITANLLRTAHAGVNQALIIDSPLGGPNAERLPEAAELVARRPRIYSRAEDAIAHFRAVPPQPSDPVVRDHIARMSIREGDGGWTWKFDARIFEGDAKMLTDLAPIDGRLAFLRAERGLVPADVRATVEGAGGIFIEIPDAGHAPMLDQPVALVTAIRAVLAVWDATPQ